VRELIVTYVFSMKSLTERFNRVDN